MEWVSKLQGKTVGLDTAPQIYFIEDNPAYSEKIRGFFEAIDEEAITAVTSTVTLLEVLVHPLRNGNKGLATEYREILLNSKILTLDVTADIAEQAAHIRATHNIRTPDAIQISAALNTGASYFLTNDIRLPVIPSLEIISLDSLK